MKQEIAVLLADMQLVIDEMLNAHTTSPALIAAIEVASDRVKGLAAHVSAATPVVPVAVEAEPAEAVALA